MRSIALLPLIALSLAIPAAAQQADGGQAAPQAGDIVVTARPLQETADALAACIARGCPPDEDIAATLAHAENQFISGDYRAARATTLASIRRNGDEARGYPVAVSDLYRANGRIASHLGEARSYQSSILNMRDALLRGLPDNDARVLAAQIEVGDSRARLGYPEEARDIYIRTAVDAERAGQLRVAAFARMRQAMIDLPSNRRDRRADRERTALAHLNRIAGQGPEVGEDLALLSEVLLARLDREQNDMARTQRLIARFAGGNGAGRPLLLTSEPIRLQDSGQRDDDSGNSLSRTTAGVDNRWIDVGYWINADGRVGEYEVLRSEGGLGGWTEAVERSVKSRVYAPLAAENGVASPGFYIVERYTLTADYATTQNDCSGTRIRCRSNLLRVERTDLTPEDLGAQPTRAS